MKVEQQICKIKEKYYWISLISLFTLVGILIISSVFSNQWVQIKERNSLGFTGSLVHINEGFNQSRQYYSELRNRFCSRAKNAQDDYYQHYFNRELVEFLHAGCDLFSGLTKGFALFFVFQILTIISLSLSVIFLLVQILCMSLLWISQLGSVLSLIFHSLSVALYFFSANLTINNCDHFRNSDQPGPLCAKSGFYLSLAALVILGVASVFFNILCLFLYNRKNKLQYVDLDLHMQPTGFAMGSYYRQSNE